MSTSRRSQKGSALLAVLWMSAALAAIAFSVSSTVRSETDRRLERLTEREREILALIAAGHPNRDVAAQLGISPRTVEVHRARIMEKLECRSLAELIAMSRAAG